MTLTDSAPARLARSILEPLSPETAELLEPVELQVNDRLQLSLDDEGSHFLVQPYATIGTQAVQASYNARYKWLYVVPEKKENRAGGWLLGATDITALIINANWPDERIEATPEALELYHYLLARFSTQTLQAQRRAQFKLQGVVPSLPPDWLEHPVKPLAPYQKVAAVTSIGQEASALFMEQGTGKTPVAIARMCVQAARFDNPKQLYRVLIIAPKNVRYNWQNEIHEFATVPGKVSVLQGTQLQRQSQLLETIMVEKGDDSRFAAVICTYEAVRKSWDTLRAVPWHLVIADEAHSMKDFRTERWKYMRQIRNISEERLILTGTPVCNSILDLFTQLEFLGEGMSGFTTWNAFKAFYGRYEKGGTLIGYQNLPFMQERLARIAFMTTKREALPNLPEKLYDVRTCEMSPRQRQRYVQLQQQLALEVEGWDGAGNKSMAPQNVLVKMLRLAQITSGFYAWDAVIDPMTGAQLEPRKLEYEDPLLKLEELVKDLKALGPNEKAIVWAVFLPDIRAIDARLTAEGIPHGVFTGSTKDADRADIEDRFNNLPATEMRVFLGNPAAGGVGLNLRGYNPDAEGTSADHGSNCSLVCYYSQGWSMVHRAQSEDRAHRRGTRVNVQYRDYVVPGTIDEEIRTRVTAKGIDALTIQDVREIMRRLLDALPTTEE